MKVAILAGGSGTRLWPLSRKDYPKQFIKINSPYSFFQKTVRRFLDKLSPKDLIISTHKDYKFHILTDLVKLLKPEEGLPHLIYEPKCKNTFGASICILRFCLEKLKVNPEEVIFLSPSDHLIQPEYKFYTYLEEAEKLASKGYIVTFGIKPRSAHTGYGYIKMGESLDLGYKVDAFIEKPSLEKVKQFLDSGGYFWNSGMFCFRIDLIIEEIKRYQPQVMQFLDMDFEELLNNFDKLPEISIDNALMEKSQRIALIPLEGIYWNDVGSFESLYEILEKDEEENVKIGNVYLKGGSGNLIISNKRLITAIGLKDTFIIETDDALLIVPKGKSQEIKELVNQLRKEGRKEALEHLTQYRPWGSYTVLEEGPRYKIKHVVVKPGEKLSLQLHHHRSEHWVVIKGMAKVLIGDMEKYVHENESAYVPKSTPHRLENPGKVDLELIEVQNGEYLGEDDIVRLEDIYIHLR
jgi:mannose-1-phosphate guanylyltransferase/mannose-6-phosphate isomerase